MELPRSQLHLCIWPQLRYLSKASCSKQNYDYTLHLSVKQVGGDTLAHHEGRRQLQNHVKRLVDTWLKQVILPFVLDMFLQFRKETEFLNAISSHNTQQLALWFRQKLLEDSVTRLYHCLQKPWGKAICLDTIFHPEAGDNETEKAFLKSCRIWCVTLVATACATVYCYAVQMEANQKIPFQDWEVIKETIKAISTQGVARGLKLDYKKLPAAEAFGKKTRVVARRDHDPDMDNVDG
ncbi:hypothetical protein ONS95_004220 [Cadophora gregata]|uniref:uncharacterized protein n=1 Tax=Cadophora gregata TaxID=51156 RepID=UPI0026DC33AF|nr:uncharacterized protein ONS95_004220 [Cadophora gregata]KAK0105694.1 hypothetical protein ONS95_004220 [Cadophora gregata]